MQRPVSVTVFGVLNLVFGGLGLCGTFFAAVMLLMPAAAGEGNPILEMMEDHAWYAAYTRVSVVLGFVATLVLIAAGVGLLLVKPWGRIASIGYAVYTIIAGVAGILVMVFVLVQPMLSQARDLPPGPERVGMIGGLVGGTVGSCVGLVYPVILLIFMMTPTVKNAFQQRGDDWPPTH